MIYSVCVNMPGYLPMSDEAECYSTKREALQGMKAHADSFREEGYSVVGSMKEGYYNAQSKETSAEYNISYDAFTNEEWEAMGNEMPL